MHNRVLMAKFDSSVMITTNNPSCGCGQGFNEGETIMLYPIPEMDDVRIKDMVCLTCHFWFVHDVLTEIEEA